MFTLRPAIIDDLEAICAVDHVAQQEQGRIAFIANAISTGGCHIAVLDQHIIGYGILDYTFFGNGFIALLYVHPDYRRQGVGTAVMQHLEALCTTPKLFTSTNLSNLKMQQLLAKENYTLSGVVHNLDEGDPELIYVKPTQRV